MPCRSEALSAWPSVVEPVAFRAAAGMSAPSQPAAGRASRLARARGLVAAMRGQKLRLAVGISMEMLCPSPR